MGASIAILCDHGVPQANISKLLLLSPGTLYKSTDLTREKVLRLVSMGFCPASMMFLHGLHVLIGITKPKWEERMALYKSFGWSENEVLSMFKKPFTMSASVKKITLSLNFFLDDLNWSREDIAKNPYVILFSLEKRVIPRCRVLQILQSKNLITKAGVAHRVRVAEYGFLKKYVGNYSNELPDLLKVYRGEISTLVLQAGSKHGC